MAFFTKVTIDHPNKYDDDDDELYFSENDGAETTALCGNNGYSALERNN